MNRARPTNRKTVADYLLEGGLKGRYFLCGSATSPIYQITSVKLKQRSNSEDVEFHMNYPNIAGVRNQGGICYLSEIIEDVEATKAELRKARISNH